VEVAYLLQFAINALMSMGVEIDLKEEAAENESRIKMPKDTTIQ
jgi:hypothetical protein